MVGADLDRDRELAGEWIEKVELVGRAQMADMEISGVGPDQLDELTYGCFGCLGSPIAAPRESRGCADRHAIIY